MELEFSHHYVMFGFSRILLCLFQNCTALLIVHYLRFFPFM
jgi:hypothetical protein